MFLRKLLIILMGLFVVVPGGARAGESQDVLVTIRPVHSLVSSVLGDTAEAGLIIEGATSPHNFSLKPSQARSIQQADIIFWIGPALEASLKGPFENLPQTAQVVSLVEAPGLKKLSVREAAADDDHGHDHGHDHDHDEHGVDVHIWLNPDNAIAMVREIERVLSAAYPDKAATYKQNADSSVARLKALRDELSKELDGAKGASYAVYHDGFQYLENAYGLKFAGAVAANEDASASASHVAKLTKSLKEKNVRCLFSENWASPKLTKALAAELNANHNVLNIMGSQFPAGKDQYFETMRALGRDISACFK